MVLNKLARYVKDFSKMADASKCFEKPRNAAAYNKAFNVESFAQSFLDANLRI